MRKTPLRRSAKPMRRSRLAPGKPLKRGAKPRAVNPERAARQRLEDFGPEAEWMRTLPCATCPRLPPSDPSHMKTRGSGGKKEHLAPQCRYCHGELGSDGVRTFESRRPGCDLLALAEEYAQRWAALPTTAKEIHEDQFRARYPAAGRLMEEK